MKIVHAASELFPYVKTGGLADAVGSLAVTLAENGHDVSVFIPGYRSVLEHKDVAGAERVQRLKIEMGDSFLSGDVRKFSPSPRLSIYLICREEFFDRRAPYGSGERDYEDNDERFLFFAKGVVETLRLTDLQADIVHCHDWQAAMIPLLLRDAERRHGATLALRTVFTIHNIAFQGVFPSRIFAKTNLPDELNTIDGLEYYNQVSFLKAGILFAERVTTVSPQYAKEIQTSEFGCGLDGVIQTRVDDLTGLLNGVNTAVWNPETDAHLPARYSATNLSGKQICREALLKEVGLSPKFSGPLYGMICRLTEQKGVQLVLANSDFFIKQNCRLVVLGAGEKRFEDQLRALEGKLPGKVVLCAKLDEALSHLIEAGSDFFLMPSLFEPCGLNQMYSQLYGSVPLASRVGGLADTVTDVDDDPESGNGLTFSPTEDGLADALERSLVLYADKPRYTATQLRGMKHDFSWKKAVAGYEQLYQDSL